MNKKTLLSYSTKCFKDSSTLLDTLAKTSDISTIPDINDQIAAMQKDFNQATTILNASTNNTQSE